jgi:nicotinamide-nucleotide amidase
MRQWRTAEIIAVGSELLTPHRLDTNSLHLTGRLNELGIEVCGKTVVGDRRSDLADRLSTALSRADIVLTIGGLGPTDDDITREAAAEVLALPLREDEQILHAIRRRFEARGLQMPEINRRQAMVPAGASVLANEHGTAPGLLIERERQLVVLLPGPPTEMRPMFDGVEAFLRRHVPAAPIRRRTLKIAGRTESHVEEIAQPIYATWRTADPPIDTTILASGGQIELHLSARGEDTAAIDRALDDAVQRLAAALGPAVFSVDGRSLEAVVGDALRGRGWRIAVAESCTAGLLLGRLTEVAGSSAWVEGGVVAYANAVKVDLLNVPAPLIDTHGAVSEPVALAMAAGVRRRLDANLGVAITGIAGPGGGSNEKPVGTVVMAVVDASREHVRTLRLQGDRQAIRSRSVVSALDMIRRFLM